jgi:TonB-linked SusC/RagA family outer membrane protein
MNNNYTLFRRHCRSLLAVVASAVVLLSSFGTAHAQAPSNMVKGKILDGQGLPLATVTVVVEGVLRGTVSDAEGYYVIEAAPGSTLVFSYLGFETQSVKVPESLVIDVVMKEDVNTIDELVVVGMGQQTRASVIGAITTVNVADIKTPARSLSNVLAGRMAGVVAVQRSGEPGYDNSDFWIRGIASFGANKTPLVLIDGVERPDAMNNVNPEEIESVSILKDASATAVYGVRAANGVVVITTRKGTAQNRPTVDLKMEYGVSTLSRVPKLLGGVDYMNLYNEAEGRPLGSQKFSPEVIEATRLQSDPFLYPDVNWLEEIYKKTSNNQQVTLNVTGGGQVARYFVSAGFLGEKGNYRSNPESDYSSNINLQRYNFRTNVDISITKSTKFEVELGGYVIDGHYPGISNGDLYTKAFVANPVSLPIRYPMGLNEDGSINYVWAGILSGTVENPVERLMGSGFTTEYKNQFLGQARITQDFGDLTETLKGLKANVSFSFDTYNETKVDRHKKDSYYIDSGRDPVTDELILTETVHGDEYLKFAKSHWTNRSMELKGQLSYDRTFADKHNLGAMAMYYQRDFRESAGNAIGSIPFHRQGVAFRATYNYDQKYFIEFNLGYNGTENFAKGERFGLFPAGAIGYLISEEKFWTESGVSNTITMLKLRGSMGLVGSESLPSGQRFAYQTIVEGGLGGYSFGDTPVNWGGTGENQSGIIGLTWEKGLKYNVGLQAEFFRKLTLEVDFFKEKRSDILVRRTALPGIVGLMSQPFANIGIMDNKGLEATLDYSDRFGDVSLRVYGNATFARNNIVFQDEPDYKYTYQNRTGKRFNQGFGLIALGYFENEEEIAASPTQTFGAVRPGDIKYLDVNGDGVVDSYDEVAIGHPNIPEFMYGFGFQAGYKGFDFAMFFRGQARVNYMLGGEGFVPFLEGGDRGNLFVEAMDRWTVDNPRQDAFYPRLSIGDTENNYRASTKWQYDGSFLRLADVEVGYNFSQKITKAIRMQGLRVYFHGSNLGIFSKFKMWDPELGKGRGDAYPMQRKFNFGLRVTF